MDPHLLHKNHPSPRLRRNAPPPPNLGTFPLLRVDSYASKLPYRMAAKGGIFFPMHPSTSIPPTAREAMWLNLSTNHHFAIKIYAGGINIVSGEPFPETAATVLGRQSNIARGHPVRDYVVAPLQAWVDGIATAEGRVCQFVAMPRGSGRSVESQITGQYDVCALQFGAIPWKYRDPPPLMKMGGPRVVAKVARATYPSVRLSDDDDSPTHEISIAPGGTIKQNIVRDNYVEDTGYWDRDNAIVFNAQMLNSEQYTAVAGKGALETPVDARAYAEAGLPFFSPEGGTTDVAGKFDTVRFVAAMDGRKKESVWPNVVNAIAVADTASVPVRLLNPEGVTLPSRTRVQLEEEEGYDMVDE